MKLALSMYAAAVCAQLAAAGSSIIGGQPANPRLAHYMISIQKNGKHICAGTLIRKNVILTAAHCVANERTKSLQLIAGSHDDLHKYGVERGIRKRIIHPEHDGTKRINDIALLRMRRRFWLNDVTSTIGFSDDEQLDAGTNVTMYGWGYTSFPHSTGKPTLQVLDRKIVDTAACNDAYFEYNGRNVTDNQVCTQTEGQGTCWGDSGGPLIRTDEDGKEYQVGIISFGVSCAKEWPDVATKISPYLKWIEDSLAANK